MGLYQLEFFLLSKWGLHKLNSSDTTRSENEQSEVFHPLPDGVSIQNLDSLCVLGIYCNALKVNILSQRSEFWIKTQIATVFLFFAIYFEKLNKNSLWRLHSMPPWVKLIHLMSSWSTWCQAKKTSCLTKLYNYL